MTTRVVRKRDLVREENQMESEQKLETFLTGPRSNGRRSVHPDDGYDRPMPPKLTCILEVSLMKGD